MALIAWVRDYLKLWRIGFPMHVAHRSFVLVPIRLVYLCIKYTFVKYPGPREA